MPRDSSDVPPLGTGLLDAKLIDQAEQVYRQGLDKPYGQGPSLFYNEKGEYVPQPGENVKMVHPGESISDAVASAKPGDTVLVAPGTYTEAVSTNTDNVRIISQTKGGAEIKWDGQSDTVWHDEGNGAQIVGFRIDGGWRKDDPNHESGARNGLGNGSDGAGGTILAENEIFGVKGEDSHNGGAALASWYGGDQRGAYMLGNYVHDNGEPHTEVPGTATQGIYPQRPGDVVIGNVVYNNDGEGIHTWHSFTNGRITDNFSHDNGGAGIGIGNGDNPGGPVENSIVEGNIVEGNGGGGVVERGEVGSGNSIQDN